MERKKLKKEKNVCVREVFKFFLLLLLLSLKSYPASSSSLILLDSFHVLFTLGLCLWLFFFLSYAFVTWFSLRQQNNPLFPFLTLPPSSSVFMRLNAKTNWKEVRKKKRKDVFVARSQESGRDRQTNEGKSVLRFSAVDFSHQERRWKSCHLVCQSNEEERSKKNKRKKASNLRRKINWKITSLPEQDREDWLTWDGIKRIKGWLVNPSKCLYRRETQTETCVHLKFFDIWCKIAMSFKCEARITTSKRSKTSIK